MSINLIDKHGEEVLERNEKFQISRKNIGEDQEDGRRGQEREEENWSSHQESKTVLNSGSVEGLRQQLKDLLTMHSHLDTDYESGKTAVVEDLNHTELNQLRTHLLSQLTNSIDTEFTSSILRLAVRYLPGVNGDLMSQLVSQNKALQMAFRTVIGWRLNGFGPTTKTLILLATEYLKAYSGHTDAEFSPPPKRQKVQEVATDTDGEHSEDSGVDHEGEFQDVPL